MLILISGPSGCGKNTVIKKILSDFPEYKYIHSTTTRAIRTEDNECEGNPYHFVSKEDFAKQIKNDEFFEYNEIHGNWYGVPKSSIDEAREPTNIVIKDIDVEGHKSYLDKLKDTDIQVFSVFLGLAPEILKERLINRGDKLESIELRLSRCSYENTFANNYDFVVQNTSSMLTAKLLEFKIQDIQKGQDFEHNIILNK